MALTEFVRTLGADEVGRSMRSVVSVFAGQVRRPHPQPHSETLSATLAVVVAAEIAVEVEGSECDSLLPEEIALAETALGLNTETWKSFSDVKDNADPDDARATIGLVMDLLTATGTGRRRFMRGEVTADATSRRELEVSATPFMMYASTMDNIAMLAR